MTQFAQKAAEFIQKQCPNFTPKLAIILGSGLGNLANNIEAAHVISYREIPGFPESQVIGHSGELHMGFLQGVPVVCMKGRIHYYEGKKNEDFKNVIRTLKLLGAETLLLTNAAGSLNENVGPGNLVCITDHINFMFNSPLVGKNDEEFGPRFMGMEDAYDITLRERLKDIASRLKISLREGVYMGVLGPAFETPAEIRAFRVLGADLVGMSTVPEVIVARHCNMRVAAISVVTNFAAGMSHEKISHEDTLHYAGLATDNLTNLVTAFIASYKDA